MGRYETPPDPYENFQMGCLRVYFPDSPFLFRALMGQLTKLETRFIWDTGGDIEAAEKLAQDWLEAGELTRQSQDSGCPDVEDCQQTIIDLTLQLEQCQDYITELENMEITVNCNCGGGSCCTPYTIPTDPDGQPFPTIPVSPTDPLEDTVPTWDEVNQVPPPTYDDWQSFIDDRCRAANWFVDSYLEMVKNSDIAERRLSAGAAVMEVVALLLAALPGPVGDWAGVVVIVKWVSRMLAALTAAVEELEDLNDWLQFAADEVAANRDTLVCAAYSMTSIEWLEEFFTTFWAGSISTEMVAAGADATTSNFIRDLFKPVFGWMAAKANDAFTNQNIPEDYIATTSCANCSLVVSGFTFVPMQIASFNTFAGHGSFTDRQYTIAADGLSAEFTGDGANPTGDLFCEFDLVAPPVGSTRYVGVAVNIQGENLNGAIIANTGASQMWDGGINVVAEGKTHAVRGPYNADYPSQIPGVSTVLKFEGVNVDACEPTAFLSLRFGGRSATAGLPVKVIVKDLYWIQDNDAVC